MNENEFETNSLVGICLFNSVSQQLPLQGGTETAVIVILNDAKKNRIFLCKQVLVVQLIPGEVKSPCEGFVKE